MADLPETVELAVDEFNDLDANAGSTVAGTAVAVAAAASTTAASTALRYMGCGTYCGC